MDEVKKIMVKLDAEQETKYEMPKGYSVELFINGYRVNQDYNLHLDEKKFRKKLRTVGVDGISETEVVFVVKHGVIKKEIIIQGFIRSIKVEDWK